jgi:hypothetical protein
MKSKLVIDSLEGWQTLPEVLFPKLKSGTEKGSIFSVHKVGFLAVPEDQCKKAGIKADAGPAGKCLLPTAVVEFDGTPKLCRLPLSLSPWAFNCVAMAHSKTLNFPSSVEFGFFNGRNYAEFVI